MLQRTSDGTSGLSRALDLQSTSEPSNRVDLSQKPSGQPPIQDGQGNGTGRLPLSIDHCHRAKNGWTNAVTRELDGILERWTPSHASPPVTAGPPLTERIATVRGWKHMRGKSIIRTSLDRFGGRYLAEGVWRLFKPRGSLILTEVERGWGVLDEFCTCPSIDEWHVCPGHRFCSGIHTMGFELMARHKKRFPELSIIKWRVALIFMSSWKGYIPPCAASMSLRFRHRLIPFEPYDNTAPALMQHLGCAVRVVTDRTFARHPLVRGSSKAPPNNEEAEATLLAIAQKSCKPPVPRPMTRLQRSSTTQTTLRRTSSTIPVPTASCREIQPAQSPIDESTTTTRTHLERPGDRY